MKKALTNKAELRKVAGGTKVVSEELINKPCMSDMAEEVIEPEFSELSNPSSLDEDTTPSQYEPFKEHFEELLSNDESLDEKWKEIKSGIKAINELEKAVLRVDAFVSDLNLHKYSQSSYDNYIARANLARAEFLNQIDKHYEALDKFINANWVEIIFYYDAPIDEAGPQEFIKNFLTDYAKNDKA